MIYFDNAATTPLHPEVIDEVTRCMKEVYGNPSSTHKIGRDAKTLVETARKNIARQFNVSANEIVFTSGGSESDNMVLYNAVLELGVKTIITSRIEHHAIIHALEYLSKKFDVKVLFVNLLEDASIDYVHLEKLLAENPGAKLVSLMMVNNELGTLLDLHRVGNLCKQYQAYFLSDTVQGIGHYSIDLPSTPIDFIAASAHKFHGPKGVGFLFVRKGIPFKPLVHGASQEHGLRAGTENVHNIAGMAKALEIAYRDLEMDRKEIVALKQYFASTLQQQIPGLIFNADSDDAENHAYHILNVRFPKKIDMFLFKLDLRGVAASGGSACQSGSDKGSHVLTTILEDDEARKTSVRFSFSKFNTKAEADEVVKQILEILKQHYI